METLRINNSDGSVDVQITEEVIAIIAGLAATEVEGVNSMAGGITNEIVARLGKKNLAAGVNVIVDLQLVIEMGISVPEVSQQVQEKVKTSIETMTGLKVKAVNIKITNVNIDNQ